MGHGERRKEKGERLKLKEPRRGDIILALGSVWLSEPRRGDIIIVRGKSKEQGARSREQGE